MRMTNAVMEVSSARISAVFVKGIVSFQTMILPVLRSYTCNVRNLIYGPADLAALQNHYQSAS